MKGCVNRACILGFGSIGKRHLSVVRSILPNVQIVVITRNPPTLYSADKTIFSSDISILETFRPEIGIVATPTRFHVQGINTLLDLGCHILVEKPLSYDADELKKLRRPASPLSRLVQVGYNLRYLESLRKVKKVLEERMLGNLLYVRCCVGQDLRVWRSGISYQDSVSAKASLGGGVLAELSHELDYLIWILGNPPKWVNACTRTSSKLEVDVEDNVHAIIGFNGNNRSGEIIVNLNMDFFRKDRTRTACFVCDEGTIEWDGIEGAVYHCGSSHRSLLHKDFENRDLSYQIQFRNFLENIEISNLPESNIDSGSIVVNLMDAIRRSSANNGVRIFL